MTSYEKGFSRSTQDLVKCKTYIFMFHFSFDVIPYFIFHFNYVCLFTIV